MKFGLYTGVHDLTLKRLYADVVDELTEQVLLCEEAGFECAWVDEHHFNSTFTNSPNPSVFGAMLAAQTSRIRLGQANVVTGWHPLRLAEDVALVDQISKGRVDLGIGRGGVQYDAAIFNPHLKDILPNPKLDVREHYVPSDQSPTRAHFAEVVEILKKAWTEPFFSHEGTHYTFPRPGFPWGEYLTVGVEALEDPTAVVDGDMVKLRVGPKPYQKPHPPIWMLMVSEASFAEAASLGLKGMVWVQPANRLRERIEKYTSIRNEKEGVDLKVGDDINVMRIVHVADTYEQAKKEFDHLLTPFYAGQFEKRPISYWFNEGEKVPESVDLNWEFYRKHHLVLAGSPDDVAEQIHELHEVAGVNYITLWMEGQGLTHKQIMSSTELFGSKVAPLFANGT